jgi:hypothetical protein
MTVVVVAVSLSLAGEVIPIGVILKDPDSYNLRVVTIQGTVQNVKPVEPYFETFSGKGGFCYGTYTFTLEDETGSIEVAHMPLCKKPIVPVPEVSKGEKIIIEAQILAPGLYAERSKGMSEERKTTQAIVKNISRP